jgi:inositol transport system substrate-binding protein
MKKFLSVVLGLVLLFSAVGCAGKNTVTETPTTVEVRKIGMLVPTLQYEFFIWLTDGLKAEFEEAGFEFTAMSYDGDANKAISIIENFTIEDVDAIIAMVGDKSADAALQAAMDEGIVVVEAGVLTDAYTIGMVADNKDVGTKIGEMAADYVNTNLNGTADVVAFINESNPDMADRSNSMIEAFTRNAPNANIVGTANYANVGEGTAAMENFLQQFPDIKVVMGYGDSPALEAIEVVRAANKAEGFAAFGCDATQQALQIISEGGLMRGTVDMGSLISLMAEPTIRYLNGDTSVPRVSAGVNTKVTIDNVSEYLK